MLPRLLIFSLALLSVPAVAQNAKALADDEAAAEMQAALTAAQSVYVWGDLQNCFSETLIFHAQITALNTSLTKWGRYQQTPTLKGSDVILEPTYSSGPEVCIIQVRDSHTLKVLGSFSEPRPSQSRTFADSFDAMTNSIMDDLKALAGKSTPTWTAPATPPPPAPAPPPQPAPETPRLSEKEQARQYALQIQAQLTAAHNILLVDDTLWSSGTSAIAEPEEFSLFQADMTAWARYQFVQSVASADLVIMVDDYMNCSRNIIVSGKLGPQCTPQIRLQVYEPTSLNFITQVVVDAKNAKPKPGKPDPFPPSVQAMTDQLRVAAGDPAKSRK